MPQTQNKVIMNWLFFVAFIVVFHSIFGAFVRLTRSGLSIVEWNPISGSMMPVGQQAWDEEFAKYQQTPEYIKVNSNMTLDKYKFIFYMEWFHRNVARFIGLVYAIPVFYFLFTKKIPFKEFGIYFLIGMLIITEAFAGWVMVASGLVDRPSVSHFNLTIHLLLALSLLGLALWTAFGHKYGFTDSTRKVKWSTSSKLAIVFLGILLIQISYGGFTAGLKAGHVSDTWPLMFGKWIPPNLFNSFMNIFISPQTIVFIHRWFAFVVLAAVIYIYYIVRKTNYQGDLFKGLQWFIAAVTLQIILGILTILSYVNIVVALLHQAGAIALFILSIYFIHRFRALDSKL